MSDENVESAAISAKDEAEIRDIVASLPDDAKELLGEVLRVERQKLHMKLPMGIVDDIGGVVRALIK